MGERISIAKAARLLGIDRHELCERLCRAGIEGFEGAVELDAVKSISPKLNMLDPKVSERMSLIRQTARRRQAAAPPRKNELELQDDLDKMHNKWLMERKKAQDYSVLFDRLVDELGHWQASEDAARAKFAIEFSHWICKQFED
ncbi:hypothetical protein [Magnetovibrio sp.]|uniref:hypothetical protein n=1 Tax=Magnetovibrio sp. TaxID=2024836 RepID=UPI002F948B5D